MKHPFLCLTLSIAALAAICPAAPLAPGEYRIHPDKPRQVIWGLGFEIQSDSIGSGNNGLPEEPFAVPHDLVPSERTRLAREMLQGFRYCRLAGGLYWRGLDAEQKHLRPRWPEQLVELKQLLDTAGVEGLSFEYWSPAPFWKGNRAWFAAAGHTPGSNSLRCFAPGFDKDPDYLGDTDRFLADFSAAVVTDIRTLQQAGFKVSMWGLQNEPHVSNAIYSTCRYPDGPSFVRAYKAVASAIRQHDPGILLFADTEADFPKKIAYGMGDPEVAALVDAYVVHTVGRPCHTVATVDARIRKELPPRPWFQNEYEYLTGGATPDRCLNTVQHIMNSFQLAQNPTWFWLHALKPLENAEASGYSLGFWRSRLAQERAPVGEAFERWPGGPLFTELPEALRRMEMATVKIPANGGSAPAYSIIVHQPVTAWLLVQQGSQVSLGAGWDLTDLQAVWPGGRDQIYRRSFPKGRIEVPASKGMVDGSPARPPVLFIEPSDPKAFHAEIGMNQPIVLRSKRIAMEKRMAEVEPGHWVTNPYNWHAVGSFVKRMPWDSRAIEVEEGRPDPNGRIFAFRRPDGRVTVVVSNRTSTRSRPFSIQTGLADARWRGYRYTPDDAGPGTMGVPCGEREGGIIQVELPPRSWEFWEQQ